MREIKFRAWHELNKEMVYFKNNKLAKDQFQALCLGRLLNGDFGDVLMQYTGLKDKNGVEIFEGDVLRILSFVDVNGKSNYLHHVIEWSDKFNGWFARNLKESGKGDGSLQLWVYAKEKKFEVVGSVHQSPELLEE